MNTIFQKTNCFFLLLLFLVSSCELPDPDPLVTLQNRFFEKLEITHGDLSDWDTSNGPDMELTLRTDEMEYVFDTLLNIQTLPVQWSLNKDIRISDATWQIVVRDIDVVGPHELMIDFNFNPYQKIRQGQNESDIIEVYFEGWKIEVEVVKR